MSAVASDELMNTSRSTGDHVSLPESRYDFRRNTTSCINESAIGNGEGLSTVDLQDARSSLDELMITACGDKLLYCDGDPRDSVWCQHWSIIVQCMGSTIHCLVVPLAENILICCVLSFNNCLWAPTIQNE